MKIKQISEQALAARNECGKGLLSQFLEILQFRFGTGKLGANEYYRFRLFDDDHFTPEEKRDFVGLQRERELHSWMNNQGWWVLSWDKIIFYSLLRAAGLPHPELVALYHPRGRFVQGVPTLKDRKEIAEFLAASSSYPIFVKPSHGVYGRGANVIYDANQASGTLETQMGLLDIEEFVDSLDVIHSDGQIFQERIKTHPKIERICGDRPSSVRLLALVTKEGIKPHRAVWKIPTGSNIVDNFQRAQSGNLVAAVDLESGKLIRSVGMSSDGQIREAESHPDTGVSLRGVQLPDWPNVLKLAKDAGTLLPRYRILHFDIALTNNGPSLLEVNLSGDCHLHQVAYGKGLMGPVLNQAIEDFKSFLEEEELAKHRLSHQK
jgi:hypothetical protein